MRDQAAGERYGAQPEQTQGGAEGYGAGSGQGEGEEGYDYQRAQGVQPGEAVLFRVTPAEPAAGERAQDVEETDHGERPGGYLGVHGSVAQVGG